jgi:hypothetical protein
VSHDEEARLLLTKARLAGWPDWVIKNWMVRLIDDPPSLRDHNLQTFRRYLEDPSAAERFKRSPLAPKEEDKLRDPSN